MDFMTANYHTHTWRCRHASGTEREYIEAAIQMGMRELGFSDHVPIPFRDGYVSPIRMTMQQAGEYVQTIRRLEAEYKGKIRLYVGFEAEYIKEYYDDQMYMFRMLDCDYLILGQHFWESEAKGPYAGALTADESRIRAYVDSILEGTKTGSYCCLAHPDIINYHGLDSVYEWEMTRLCEAMKERDIPLELNLSGVYDGKHYPSPAFWQIAGTVGNKVILGTDAHSVEQIGHLQSYQVCMDMAKNFNLDLINTISI